jgi:hypothetical protein
LAGKRSIHKDAGEEYLVIEEISAIKKKSKPDVVVQAWNPKTLMADVGES